VKLREWQYHDECTKELELAENLMKEFSVNLGSFAIVCQAGETRK
jgi:hypothetical protein